MISRPLWARRIQLAWEKVSIVWLTGVRRVGKTTLAREFQDAYYLNCDLQDAAKLLEKPESFFPSVKQPILILDEVHQLSDPSRVLKVGADVFPDLKILATGSSTLSATQKFKDSLTGRKRSIELTPVLHMELPDFHITDLRQRLFRGGMPSSLLSAEYDPGFYAEWLDSYFARDVQELFSIGKRAGFLKLCELVIRQSGGLAEATTLAKLSGLTRPTVENYLDVFEATHVIHRLRPFHAGGRQEILKQPKLYAFDTGFVCYQRGWRELHDEDAGLLWEHLVLDALKTHDPAPKINYWRDKSKREVDFVLPTGGETVHAVECQWNENQFDAGNLRAFRALHPHGENYVVSPFVNLSQRRQFGNLTVHIVSLLDLINAVSARKSTSFG